MSDRFPARLSPTLRRAAPLLLLAALGGCGGHDANTFAPACPRPAILADAADITRYRPGATGQDLTDMVLSGRVVGVSGQCSPGDKATQLKVSVQVTLELSRGPAATGPQEDVPYFIAVSEGEAILDKKSFAMRATFPSNVDKLRLASDPVELVLPVSPDKSGVVYTVTAGFQLTPEELARNRARGVR
jgi:hypothetical protein